MRDILQLLRPISPSIWPAGVFGLLYLVLLGHRHDYLGHFAAGYGGTLVALALVTQNMPAEHFAARAPLRVFLVLLACIAGGAYAEVTIFNIAKFDEVDFCNQSLGAVLAALGFLANIDVAKPDVSFFRLDIFAGLAILHVGFFFAIS